MPFMLFFKYQKKPVTVKAFSLLEVLLSVFVMSVGLMTIVAVMSGSMRHSYDTRDTIIASGLAQEGVELVRNVRDNDFDPIVVGDNGFAHIPNLVSQCRIDWKHVVTNDVDCANDGGRPAVDPSRYYLQYVGGKYEHASATKERFSRYIYISKSGSGDTERAEVRSFVYWGTLPSFGINGSTGSCTLDNKCVFVESFLASWK